MTGMTLCDVRIAQPTCRLRPQPSTAAPKLRSLEITHAHRLRRKLADADADRALVVNVWGIGYRLCDHAPAKAAA